MKFLFDLFPVILFFVTYKLASKGGPDDSCVASLAHAPLPLTQEPILLATLVAIVATFIQVGWLLLRRKKVDTMLWVSLSIIVVFGGATLYLRDPNFIQWKPTIVYWLFGLVLLGSQLFLGKNLIRQAMSVQGVALPDKIWNQLNSSWAIFFLAMGGVNLWAAKSMSCSAWVSFKLYGLTGMMIGFVVLQSLFLSKYIKETE